jgi:hypothetical protein
MYRAIQSAKLMQAVIAILITGGVIFWVGAEMGRLSSSFSDKSTMEDTKAKLAEIFEKAVTMEKDLEPDLRKGRQARTAWLQSRRGAACRLGVGIRHRGWEDRYRR